MTETGPIITWVPLNHKRSIETGGTVGKLIPNTIAKIIPAEEASNGINNVFYY